MERTENDVIEGFPTMKRLLLVVILLMAPLRALSDEGDVKSPIVGRWDLVVKGPDGEYPSWLAVERSGYTTLVGSFVGRVGSARPISRVWVRGNELHFSVPPQWESRRDDQKFTGQLQSDELTGQTTDEHGRTLTWVGHRAPALKRSHPPHWGQSIELFNGKNLEGWKGRHKTHGWEVHNGLLINAHPGTDLVSTRKFNDFKLHTEFRYPKGSNSGVYLLGRYEVQIQDDYGQEPDSHRIGGIYGFLTPSVNASKPADEWQVFDVTLVGRVVSVWLNGERIIDRQTIPGITGGALDSNEGAPGPIMLQGDHGAIEFRKVSITPAE